MAKCFPFSDFLRFVKYCGGAITIFPFKFRKKIDMLYFVTEFLSSVGVL